MTAENWIAIGVAILLLTAAVYIIDRRVEREIREMLERRDK